VKGLPIYAMCFGAVSLAGSTPEVVAGVIYNPVSDLVALFKAGICTRTVMHQFSHSSTKHAHFSSHAYVYKEIG